MTEPYKIIEVKESVFADNDREAARLRTQLKQDRTFLLNLMSSPGSGKTTTLLRTLEALKDELRIGVMEADIDSDVDAKTIADAGVKSIQLHTGGMCHLDASMTEQGLKEIGTKDLDLVVLENVGNLVCPAEFDTGAVKNAMILSVPFSVLLGMLCGKLLNMSKGREMITSYIISFFINGVYQLIVLYMMGSIIPIKHFSLKLPRGYGIRNTVSLLNMRQCVDNLLAVNIGGVKIPVLTFIIIALFCLFIVWFRKTKLGQDMRAVGQDMEVARDAGIKVERTRIISIVMSTVFSGFGMIIYLQNMGNIATYSSHSQIGMFCIAALLVGGASVDKASIGNVFLGVILFHTMFIVAPSAGAKITGDSMIGEYFRVFVSYAVITVALIMYETKKRKQKSQLGQQLAREQLEEEKK